MATHRGSTRCPFVLCPPSHLLGRVNPIHRVGKRPLGTEVSGDIPECILVPPRLYLIKLQGRDRLDLVDIKTEVGPQPVTMGMRPTEVWDST